MDQLMYTSLFPHPLLLVCSSGVILNKVSEVALLVYVCMVITYNRVRINRVSIPNLLVVS